MIEIRKTFSPDGMLRLDYLTGVAFSRESGAHRFVISGPEAFTGTVTASFMRADGQCVIVTGSLDEDGRAVVTADEDCYLVPGRMLITVYVTDGGVKTCVYAGLATVYDDRGSGEAPSGETTRTIEEMLEEILEGVDNAQQLLDDAGELLDDVTAEGATQVAAVQARGDQVIASIPSDYSTLAGEVGSLKSAFRSEIIYKDTSVYALEWTKGRAINSLGRYASSHPEAVSLLSADKCPYVYAGTTFTVGSGYTASMSIWSEPLTGSISSSNRLYLVRDVAAGTVTAPVDGYIGLSIAKADGTSISDDVLAEDFANTAVTSCEIYVRTVKTEISDADARIDALYATTNDASIWSSGKWATGNGAAATDTKLIKSKKFIPTDYMHDALGVSANTGYEFAVMCWTQDGTYKGSWTGDGFSTSASTFFTRLMFSEITSGHKYALNVKAKDGSDITVSAYTNISFIVPTCYKKVDTDQGLANAGKTMMVGDDGKVAPKRQGIDYHTDLINAQRGIAVDWHLPFIDLADEMMLGANHQIPGTATLWSDTGTADLVQKNVWMSDGTHPYRGVGLVDMYGRAIANRMALITPSYHDGAGQSTPTYWADKKLLWMGTSIPAGSDPEAGDGDGATYPSLVATQLGANVTNIAKGSSMLRIASSTGAWNGVAYSHFLRAMTRMVDEADALAEDWANIYASIPNAPSELPSADLQTMKNLSYENLLLPYLDGTNTAPDAIVIDYGHNDIANGIDGGRDFWVRPTQESIASGLLAEDTWMTANSYANLKLALNDDLSGITDLPAFAASLNRNCFIGAANFLITVILRYKPYMRIIFVSDYN